MTITTPAMVEKRLKDLGKELDFSHDDLVMHESKYFTTKAEYEIALARSRMNLAYKSAPNGKNYTVGEREDLALIENEEMHLLMATVEAQVRASRANASRLKTQVDITRSVSSSIKSSMEVI